ncbi:hypothetical protein HMH01_09545 [Halovulum dunhuangense]|uniref:Uncharacterized protein n=1 Tax=Halovulum dunhuangense TaxID=1505036 RepID=A0A849L2T9_9RHOB|nr:hypothetical protein [Halovulum dunhuangense]NNU80678.1 hypothetical protein [Halovulum dunhuangense]
MAFETLKASIYALLEEIAATPKDAHVAQERLREKLSEMRALGQPLPEDLVELEDWLETRLEEGSDDHAAPLPERFRGPRPQR